MDNKGAGALREEKEEAVAAEFLNEWCGKRMWGLEPSKGRRSRRNSRPEGVKGEACAKSEAAGRKGKEGSSGPCGGWSLW